MRILLHVSRFLFPLSPSEKEKKEKKPWREAFPPLFVSHGTVVVVFFLFSSLRNAIIYERKYRDISVLKIEALKRCEGKILRYKPEKREEKELDDGKT